MTKLKRLMAGSYESPDGRFEVYRDPTVMGNWFGPSWVINDKRTGRTTVRPTLREVRTVLAVLSPAADK